MIVIAYDGSDDAKAALEGAAKLFGGETATVVTVWQRFIDTMARVGSGVAVAVDSEEIDKASEQQALETARAGAELAKAAGLDATGRAAVVESSVADAILGAAAELEADAVVVGTRGHTGVKSLLLGSVSHHLVQHADRPAIVIPSPDVASGRAEHRASSKP